MQAMKPLPTMSTGMAATDLGLGGMLKDQVAGETEEERRKRMKEMQDRQMLGPAGSPATQMLLGGSGGYSG